MKKILKSIISLSLLFFVVFGLTACNAPLSATTVSDEKSIVNGVSTNGGITAIHGDYLYFINGTKTNDGTSSRNNVQGAICKVKYDVTTGKAVENSEVEVVVSDLVGFEDGSINIFGDFLYYATPSADINYQGSALCHKTEFKRYDLVNGNSHSIYTTHLNNESETTEYEYYVVGEDLYLMVYENVSKTLTSIKVGDNSQVIYKISDVESCVFSDTNGKRVDQNVVDANDFVFYSKSPTIETDGYDEGSKIFRVSPNKNDSKWLGNESSDGLKHNLVTVLSIKNGKLIYSDESRIIGDTFIYAQSILTDSMLEFNDADIISRKAYNLADDMILFDELTNGNISIVAYNSTSYQIVYIEKENGENKPHTILGFGEKTDVDFVGTATINEVEKNDNDEVIKTDVVEYLLYTVTASSKVTLYRLELKRNGVIATSPNLEVVVEDANMVAINGLIMPEVIANNLFVIAKNEDENIYMHHVDLTKEYEDENLIFVGKE